MRWLLLALALTAVVGTSFGRVTAQSTTSAQPIDGFPELDAALDWPWWRGPSRNGIATNAGVPARFGESENVVWKQTIPGRGHSSPIVVQGKVFLATADDNRQTQSVLAFDVASGKPLWNRVINQGGFPEENHRKNTEASTTLASDGRLLYVTFFHHRKIVLTAIDLNGNVAWEKAVGPYNPQMYKYGYAASPLLVGSSVIVSGEYDGRSWLTALDRKQGRELWRTPRPQNITFSSPVVAKVAGRDQLLLSGSQQVCAYNPQSGQLLWSVPGTTAATCGTMIWNDQLVFASGGYPKAETIAVAADGSRRIAWKNNQKCYEQSMIIVDGFVYALTDKGVMYCWQADDGREMWRERLAGPVSSSPVLAGGLIYWANENGSVFVFRPNSQRFDLVCENRLGQEIFASPAVADNRLLWRYAKGRKPNRQEYLICIGTSGE